MKLTEPTSIAALYAAPEKFVGKPVRLDGVVTAVCEEMGCWMALADSADSRQTVRFKVDHDGAITFPIAARGKRASAEGVFQRIDAGDKEGNEAAREQLAAQPTASDFGKKYQVKVTGAVRPLTCGPAIRYSFVIVRMNIASGASAGVARLISPRSFFAISTYLSPASMPIVTPSSLRKNTLPFTAQGDAENVLPMPPRRTL